MSRIPSQTSVRELQGPYGPLQILEGKIQQVWALQELMSGDWRTVRGLPLKVIQAGKWNRGGGPDFTEAILELGGKRITGDVEIHLYREDWWRHGHHLDPAYNAVILHVVLFSGGIEREVECLHGGLPEEWVMGAWMREDLEVVSGGETGLFGELVPELQDWLQSESPESMRARLSHGADRRWQQKESMARCLLDNLGWEDALHQMMLFYLGYPVNRRAFHEMAASLPPAAWSKPEILSIVKERWKDKVEWGTGRPSNRAGLRLKQYHSLCKNSQDWPVVARFPPANLLHALEKLLPGSPEIHGTRAVRRVGLFREWQHWIRGRVFRDALNASLADRLWVDVLLPMLAADSRMETATCPVVWFHSSPGSFPDPFRGFLKVVGVFVLPEFPLCNGWVQGLLWAEDQLRMERVRSSLGRGGEAQSGSGA